MSPPGDTDELSILVTVMDANGALRLWALGQKVSSDAGGFGEMVPGGSIGVCPDMK